MDEEVDDEESRIWSRERTRFALFTSGNGRREG